MKGRRGLVLRKKFTNASLPTTLSTAGISRTGTGSLARVTSYSVVASECTPTAVVANILHQ